MLIPFGILAASGGAIPYFLGILRTGSVDNGYRTWADASGNFYLAGESNSTGKNTGIVSKYDLTGALLWQKRFSAPASATFSSAITDSSNNVIVSGTATDSSSRNLLVKYNSAGTIQWQQVYGPGNSFGNDVKCDSSDNIYVCGTVLDSGFYRTVVAKFNASGTFQWSQSLFNSNSTYGSGLSVDPDGTSYIAMDWADQSVNNQNRAAIVKLNTSGVIQWQRRLTGTSSPNTLGPRYIATDSSGNVFVVGYTLPSSTLQCFIAKYDSSGNFQWARSLTRTGGFQNIDGISIDAVGNAYICGNANNDAWLVKYNTNGTIQWQRSLSSTGTDGFFGVKVASNGALHIAGTTSVSGNNDMLLMKLPSDGSLTGTYVVGGYSFTYGASSFTDSAGIASDSSIAMTQITTSYTPTATGYADSNGDLTYSSITI